MQVDGFPGCCSLNVISGLYFTGDYVDDPEAFEKLKEKYQTQLEDKKAHPDKWRYGGPYTPSMPKKYSPGQGGVDELNKALGGPRAHGAFAAYYTPGSPVVAVTTKNMTEAEAVLERAGWNRLATFKSCHSPGNGDKKWCTLWGNPEIAPVTEKKADVPNPPKKGVKKVLGGLK
jgi:hypothetical protein